MTTPSLHNLYPDWELIRLLGEGAFGKVYEIKRGEGGLEEHAALKVIHIPQSKSEIQLLQSEGADVSAHFEELAKQLSNEIATQAKLKGNSNIVSYEDRKIVPDDDGIGQTILIRMELLTPLLDLMASNSMGQAEVLQLGLDMAKALLLCERFHIIHRDIKPQNIFISAAGDYKLGDFGVARQLEQTTANLSRKGTYNYMAPEVFHGRACNATVDIYSLGIVLYTLLNGNRAPFLPSSDTGSTVTNHDRESAQTKRLSGEALQPLPHVPGALNEVILKMCAFESKDRYQNARELMAALDSVAYALQGEKTISLRSWIGDNTPGVAPPMDAAAEDEGSRWIDGTPVKHTPVSSTAMTVIPGQPHRPEPKKKNWLVRVLAAAVVVLAAVVVVVIALNRDKGAIAAADNSTNATSTAAPTTVTTAATAKPTTTKAPTASLNITGSFKGYDVVKFGGYEWMVLAKENNKALLLMKNSLGHHAYNTEITDITWADCSLRRYLNGSFYNSFSSADRARIAQVTNSNPDNTWGKVNGVVFGTNGGSSTQDYIFCLSVPEVLKYFPVVLRDETFIGEEIDYVAEGSFMLWLPEEDGYAQWLTRSPGLSSGRVCVVSYGGIYDDHFKNESTAVRPALWLKTG